MQYKTIEGTSFKIGTPDELCILLNKLRSNGTVVKIYCGDKETGIPWTEEYDTIGTIGRSTGQYKIPLIIGSRKHGGPAILEDCIIGIRDRSTGKMLYQAKNFQPLNVEIKPCTDMPEYSHATYVNGELYGRHKSLRSAQICKNKIQ